MSARFNQAVERRRTYRLSKADEQVICELRIKALEVQPADDVVLAEPL
jgi:hypothetical protein